MTAVLPAIPACGPAPAGPAAGPAIDPSPGPAASSSPAETPGRDDPAAAYSEALRLYRAGRTREALDVIRRIAAAGKTTAGLRSLAGWCHLRGGEIDAAGSEFEAALTMDPGAVDPAVGLGYVLLRRGQARGAAERFQAVLGRAAGNLDALKGYGLALRDLGRHAEAAETFRRALRQAQGDAEAAAYLEQALAAGGGGGEVRPRPAAPADAPLVVVAKAADRRFFSAGGGGFRPLFVKGVNMGVALPGRFPAEFPEDEATYARWLEAISDLGANAVRLYTLLPPAFYRALLAHNRGAAAPRLWLIQGVWTEIPPGDDYDAAPFLDGFRAGIRRAIDAVHGNLDLPARPGQAHGSYRADVSSCTLAYLLGREWEPFSVLAYDRRAGPGRNVAAGRYVSAPGGTPFERWLAAALDFTFDYETRMYRRQRPVSFVSWPTLDPLHHPTEATGEEERAARRRRGGGPSAENVQVLEYDNDAVGVDATRLRASPEAPAGIFASYHAYPYYPDFMIHDPGYLRARDAIGPSPYIGYLRDLARHHGDQPVLVAEFGVPSSRGVAHLHPFGWHHGGHDERAKAGIDARLLGDIHEAGLAGGVLFALLDEWFKRNWLVSDFEVPAERNPLWLNALNPEQHYGVLAARPGTRPALRVDGRGGDWAGIRPLAARPTGGPERPIDRHDGARTLRALYAAADEAYLYLRLDVARLDSDGDGAPDWGEVAYLVGIDTYDARRGDHRLPLREAAGAPRGLEFCLVLDGPGTSRLLVDPPYDLGAQRGGRPFRSEENRDGRFIEIRVEANRERIGRDGTFFAAREHNLSALRHGSLEPADPDHDTLADWRAGASEGVIEVRLPWGLLSVTDPSSRRVVHDGAEGHGAVGTAVTPGFRFYAAAFRPEGRPGGETPLAGRLADRLPPGDGVGPDDLPLFAWPTWDRPAYRIEKKEGWPILQQAFRAIPASGGSP